MSKTARTAALAIAATLSSCEGSPSSPTADLGVGQDAGRDAGQDAGRDAGRDLGVDAGRDAGRDLGVDAGRDAGTPPVNPPVRFAVLGDAGEGNAAQYALGQQLGSVCRAHGCDFVLYLGDNFYDSGVDSVADDQFDTQFEMPYASVDELFYVVMGNHDYGGLGVVSTDWGNLAYEVQYGASSSKWRMPAGFYGFTQGRVDFFGFDTTAIVWDHTKSQQEIWIDQQLGASTRPWRIGFGHHPYRSNGQHGNAGNYDGYPSWLPELLALRGDHMQDFFETHLCGELDVYFAGHDHNRQWLSVDCGTLHIVSGAGAKTDSLARRDGNVVSYEEDTEVGFLHVEIIGDTLRGRFFDTAGNVDFEELITRPSMGLR